MAFSFSFEVLLALLISGGVLVEATARPGLMYSNTPKQEVEAVEERVTIPSFLLDFASPLDPEQTKQYADFLQKNILGERSTEFCKDAKLVCDSNIAIDDSEFKKPGDGLEDGELVKETDKELDPEQGMQFGSHDIIKEGKDIILPENLHYSAWPTAAFLPDSLAEKMPFSTDQVNVLLDTLHIDPNSNLANLMSRTLSHCESSGEGEQNKELHKDYNNNNNNKVVQDEHQEEDHKEHGKCVTSLKEMVSFVEKSFPSEKHIKALDRSIFFESDEFKKKDQKEVGVEEENWKEVDVEKKGSKQVDTKKVDSKEEGWKEVSAKEEWKEVDAKKGGWKEVDSKEEGCKEVDEKVVWKEEDVKKEGFKQVGGKENGWKKVDGKEGSWKEVDGKEGDWKEVDSKGKGWKEVDAKNGGFKEVDVKKGDFMEVDAKKVAWKEVDAQKKSSVETNTKKKVVERNGWKEGHPRKKCWKEVDHKKEGKKEVGVKKVSWKVVEFEKYKKAVLCKRNIFAFAVFKCYDISKINYLTIYNVKLEGKDGVYRKEVAICHHMKIDSKKSKKYKVKHHQANYGKASSVDVTACYWVTNSLIWAPAI